MDATRRFTGHAAAYDAARPVYPREAVDAVFEGLGEPARLCVADLGAGTGISSRLLGERGAQVFAVEPNAAMREQAGEMRYVTWIAAAAERTGLPEASVDVVAAFQAFHWFDRPATFAEIRRILRPRGRGACVYYERDEDDAFTAGYGTLVRRFAIDDTERCRAEALREFEAWDGWESVARTELRGEQVLDAARLRERVRGTSYLPQTGAAAAALTRGVEDLFQRNAIDGTVKMTLVTTVSIARLR